MAVAPDHLPSFLVFGPVGSGITSTLKAFREFGYLTVAGVVPDALERYLALAGTGERPLAISPEFNPHEVTPTEACTLLEFLKQQYPNLKLLYLSTPTDVLVQRFVTAEKKHCYETNGLKSAIESEQLIYKALKKLSDYHIDTSSTTATELTLKIAKVLNINVGVQPLQVNLVSFGFKNGVPTDAELVFDMRFLPNPFYDETLRPLTGLDQPVRDYVFNFAESREFIEYWQKLLAHTLPLYQKQGKTRVTIGIGCTGGQHRSVAMTMAISSFLQETFPDYDIRIIHREQNHWPKPSPAPKIGA